MKKAFLIVSLALLATAAFAQVSQSKSKFAHVNSTELIQLCPEADEARATLLASQKEAQETGQAMVEEFQTKYKKYQAEGADWTKIKKDAAEKELAEIEQRIQDFQGSVQQELAQQQQTLFKPIYEKVNKTIENIAKAEGYIYVFDVTAVLYVDTAQSADITAEARKALNIPEGRTLESLQKEMAELAPRQ